MIFEAIQSHPKETIALKDDKKTVLYENLMQEVETRAEMLKNVFVLAIGFDNSVEWVLWDLAALYSETPCVPLPPFFTKGQIDHVIKTAGGTGTSVTLGTFTEQAPHLSPLVREILKSGEAG